jgi:hypothetical protein
MTLDEIIRQAPNYGLAGLISTAFLWYVWYMTTRTIPRLQRRHVTDLKLAHAECSQTMHKMSSEFAAFIKEHREKSEETQERMLVRLANVEGAIYDFLKHAQG